MSGQVIPIRREFVDEHGTRWVWKPEPQDHDGSIIPCPGAVEPLRLPPRPGRKAEMMRLGIRYFGALLAVALLLSAPSVEARSSAYQGYNVAGRSAQWQGFSPTWIVGLSGWWRADLGVTEAAGPVTATGTTPPTVTLSGTPTATQTAIATPYVEIDCTTLGVRGTSLFTFKVNGSTTATNVASAASGVVVTGSGLTAGWAAGASAVNDVYTSNVVTGSWADQSGKGHTVTQGTSSARPSWTMTDGPTGGPVLGFVAASTQFLTASYTEPQPDERYVVAKFGAQPNNTVLDGVGGNNGRIFVTSATIWEAYAGAGITTNGTGYTYSNWYAYGALFNGTSSLLFQNGVQRTSGNAGASAIGGIYIGSFGNGSTTPWTGSLTEVIDVAVVVDWALRARLAGYLNNRGGT